MKGLSRDKKGERLTLPAPLPEDKSLDSSLRPRAWEDFIGQERIKENLQVIIQAARKRKDPAIEHLLFYGNAGLGKTTLSYLIAKELGSDIKITSGPAIEKPGDLAAILTNLSEGDVLFVDEIHRLYKTIEEFLYPAMEDFKLHIILGRGPLAKTVDIDLAKFTLVGATTRIALLSSPLRSRFGAIFQLGFYPPKDLAKIIERSARILKIDIEPKAITTISQRSRLTPRIANRLLKRVRDWAQVKGQGIITSKICQECLDFLEVDEMGLEPGDRRILETLLEKFNGGPVGLQALAAASFEEPDTILDIYEPYLMQLGFIERTPRGRVATALTYKRFKKASDQKNLF